MPKNDDNNPIQTRYNRKLDDLTNRENGTTFDSKTADPSQGNDNIADVNKAENNPSWRTNLNKLAEVAASPAMKAAGIPKSKNPLILILIIIFGGGFTLTGLFSALNLLPIDVVSQFFDKGDMQNTSMTIRMNEIINDKMSSNTTSGCGSIVSSLLCKYQRPSNKLLNALDEQGVKAYDKSGNLIEGTGLFPNSRPEYYTFTDSKGIPHDISASEFSSRLASDPEFRAAFHNAYSPKFIGYADTVFKKVEDFFHFTASDPNTNAKDAQDVTDNLDAESKGPENSVTSAEGNPSAVGSAVEEELATAGTAEIEEAAEGGKGGLVGLIAGGICAISDVPGLIISVARAYQLAQLVDYAADIVVSVEAMKANDATPTEATAIGNLLTAVVAGKSAMDSFGIKYTLFGDTATTDSDWTNFIAGGSATSLLGKISSITSPPGKQQVCTVATSPVTGATIDGLLAPETAGIGPAINAIGAVVGQEALQQFAPGLIDDALKAVPPGVYDTLAKSAFGDITQDLAGEDVGDALTSGFDGLMSQTANAGGNVPLTVGQAVAYNNTTQQVNLAYAQEDRATLSPLDATNPNTFLGSIVNQLLPYYSNMGSIAGALTSVASIVTGSIGSVLQQSTAGAESDNGSQYTLCKDPSIADPSSGGPIAADPYCNIEYGIPPNYLSKDPEEVASELIQSHDIDGTNGAVIPPTNDPSDQANQIASTVVSSITGTAQTSDGSYSSWLSYCNDGTTTHDAECELTPANVRANPMVVDYALYTIDHRVQTTMDGEDPTLDPSTSDISSTSTASSTSTTDTSSSTTTDSSTSSSSDSTVPATTDSSTTSGDTTTTTDQSSPSAYVDTHILGSIVLPKSQSAIAASSLDRLLAAWLPPKRYEGTTI